jgi:hypothetical protein
MGKDSQRRWLGIPRDRGSQCNRCNHWRAMGLDIYVRHARAGHSFPVRLLVPDVA